MGWADGSRVMNEIIDAVKANVPDPEVRKRIYRPIYGVLRDQDWDTVDESLFIDRAFNAVVAEDDPEYFDGGWTVDYEGPKGEGGS